MNRFLSTFKFSITLQIFLSGLLFVTLVQETTAQVRPAIGGSSRLMNNALSEMNKGDYEKANSYFRQIIESNLPIPPEMPYFFATTLYELGQFDNSSVFLEKYLEINGFQGDNYEAAIALQSKLKAPMEAIAACRFCNPSGYRYAACPTCDGKRQLEQACGFCKGRGLVGCNQCMGRGLTTKRNIFNIVEYHECTKCGGDGRLVCPRCDGNLREFSDCRTCNGQGRLLTEEICDHQPSPRNMSQKFERLREMAGH